MSGAGDDTSRVLYPYFFTGTFERDFENCRDCWTQAKQRFQNFYYQVKRRYKDGAFLYVIEDHKDGWPHVHALIFLPAYYYERDKYVRNSFRDEIKSYWPYGISDIQRPKRNRTDSIISYSLKYSTKSSSSSYFYKRLFSLDILPKSSDGNDWSYNPRYAAWKYIYDHSDWKSHKHCGVDKCLVSRRRLYRLIGWSRDIFIVLRAEYNKDRRTRAARRLNAYG